MTKIPPYSLYATEIRGLLREGRRQDAMAYAARQLRAGVDAPLFLQAIAELLDPVPARGRGRPGKESPRDWLQVGSEFEEMKASGITHQDALAACAAKYAQSERSVERAVAYYRKAKAVSNDESRR